MITSKLSFEKEKGYLYFFKRMFYKIFVESGCYLLLSLVIKLRLNQHRWVYLACNGKKLQMHENALPRIMIQK